MDDDIPYLSAPGSFEWDAGIEFGSALDRRFPGQDAHEFGLAVAYNDRGPLEPDAPIQALVMVVQGERDRTDWTWLVLINGTWWAATGGCDYTGWDCQSWLDWCEAIIRVVGPGR
jgi:hypothetical protein